MISKNPNFLGLILFVISRNVFFIIYYSIRMTDVAPATCEGLVEQEVIKEASETLVLIKAEDAKENNKEWNPFIYYKSCLVRDDKI